MQTRPLEPTDVPDLQAELTAEITRSEAARQEIIGSARFEDPVARHFSERFGNAIANAQGCLVLSRELLALPMTTLNRANFEQVISLFWGSQAPANGERLHRASLNEMARLVRNMLRNGHAEILRRSTGAVATDEFLATPALDNAQRPPRFDEMARASRLERPYAQLYGMMSLVAHGHATELNLDTPTALETCRTLLEAVREIVSEFALNNAALPVARLYEILGLAPPDPAGPDT